MDAEVGRTLAELERKLHDLEQALSGVGAGERPMQQQPSRPGEFDAGGARLVDEAAPPPRQAHWGGGAAQPAAPAGRVPEPPAPWPQEAAERERIDLAELVAFRDRLEATMRELVDEYDRIISLRRASERPAGR